MLLLVQQQIVDAHEPLDCHYILTEIIKNTIGKCGRLSQFSWVLAAL